VLVRAFLLEVSVAEGDNEADLVVYLSDSCPISPSLEKRLLINYQLIQNQIPEGSI